MQRNKLNCHQLHLNHERERGDRSIGDREQRRSIIETETGRGRAGDRRQEETETQDRDRRQETGDIMETGDRRQETGDMIRQRQETEIGDRRDREE